MVQQKPGAEAPGSACQKSPFGPFSPSCFQNCKINFCSMILQFCRCGGLLNAKGHPDGFLSHFSSLRNFWLGGFSCSLTGCGPPVSVYSIRGPAVNRMFSFDARPSWRVAGNGMPLPAVRCRPEQTIVKMEMAPDLSLRGRFAPVAISGRHLQSVQATVKTVCTNCVCSGVP